MTLTGIDPASTNATAIPLSATARLDVVEQRLPAAPTDVTVTPGPRTGEQLVAWTVPAVEVDELPSTAEVVVDGVPVLTGVTVDGPGRVEATLPDLGIGERTVSVVHVNETGVTASPSPVRIVVGERIEVSAPIVAAATVGDPVRASYEITNLTSEAVEVEPRAEVLSGIGRSELRCNDPLVEQVTIAAGASVRCGLRFTATGPGDLRIRPAVRFTDTGERRAGPATDVTIAVRGLPDPAEVQVAVDPDGRVRVAWNAVDMNGHTELGYKVVVTSADFVRRLVYPDALFPDRTPAFEYYSLRERTSLQEDLGRLAPGTWTVRVDGYSAAGFTTGAEVEVVIPEPPAAPPPPPPSPVVIDQPIGVLATDGSAATICSPNPLPTPAVERAVDGARNGGAVMVLDDTGTVHHSDGRRAVVALEDGHVPVALAADPGSEGAYVVTARGRIHGVFGAGPVFDLGALGVEPVSPVVDAAAVADGLLLVAADGGVFTIAGAQFHGSAGALPLNQPIVTIAVDPDGAGYWLIAADGGVFAYDAAFRGSLGDLSLVSPVIDGFTPRARRVRARGRRRRGVRVRRRRVLRHRPDRHDRGVLSGKDAR